MFFTIYKYLKIYKQLYTWINCSDRNATFVLSLLNATESPHEHPNPQNTVL